VDRDIDGDLPIHGNLIEIGMDEMHGDRMDLNLFEHGGFDGLCAVLDDNLQYLGMPAVANHLSQRDGVKGKVNGRCVPAVANRGHLSFTTQNPGGAFAELVSYFRFEFYEFQEMFLLKQQI
jgi:hypothetical protein